ncbi:MAG: peptide transporter ATPase [Rickettsiaceae bacterium]|jgi:lipoprotein-releasing system ATP-binding protein|nr:peptide transporter ATPase [Rickettsiaceae bacterium]
MSNIILKLENITKSYKQGADKIEILQDINLEVREGELIGIIGASGSGKSTLLHIAGLLDSATSGTLSIQGAEIKDASENILNKLRLEKLGFVYQYHHLLKDFRAVDNVVLPQLLLKTKKDEAYKIAQELLLRLGLKGKEHNYPGELSGGEQQRVAIARAFANKPSIIFADEPTGNLDPHTAEEVFAMLVENTRANKVATIIVTHNHELAAKMDTRYLLKEGKLLRQQ